MPFALALFASALLHVAALVSPGWTLPGTEEAEAPPATIDAVLAKPPVRTAVAPTPKAPAHNPHQQRDVPAILVAESATAMPAPSVVATANQPQAEAPAAAPLPSPVVVPAPPTPVRTSLPGRGRLRYSVTHGEGGMVVGQSVHTWEHDGFRYKLESVTETTGLAAIFKPARVVQTSQGELTAAGLLPREFRQERASGIDAANFDWMRHVVAYAGREDGLADGTQDMLSMYYQLVLLAPRSGVLEMHIATGRKLENFRFEVLGEEVVALASGSRRTTHLRTRSGNDTIDMWLAAGEGAERRGLPLKIRFTDRKGDIFDQLAEEIDIQDKP